MNTRIQILLVLAVISLTVVQKANANRRMHVPRSGACSTRLMDTLREMCGSAGVKMMRNFLIMIRYRSRFFKERKYHLRRSRSGRSVDDFKSFNYLTFEQAREQEDNTPLGSIISTANKINKERKIKSRVRRQIAHDCCNNDCDWIEARNAYCQFHYH